MKSLMPPITLQYFTKEAGEQRYPMLVQTPPAAAFKLSGSFASLETRLFGGSKGSISVAWLRG